MSVRDRAEYTHCITRKIPTLFIWAKLQKGTTKSERTLRARLNEHVSKIEGVQGLNLTDMKCRYLTLASEWWVFAAEYALIVHYNPAWNTTGFGSKVPGKGRPGTPERVSKFDKLFPKA